jgi:hypothetical protein
MSLCISGFGLHTDFVKSHVEKQAYGFQYRGFSKPNFLNFFAYVKEDENLEILKVGCNQGGLTSFIQSQRIVRRRQLPNHHKQFMDNALSAGLKRLPEIFLNHLNDLDLNMGFTSWDGVIDDTGDIMIVGICKVEDEPNLVKWTHLLISPLMLDYSKLETPVEQRFSLKEMRELFSVINAA